MGIRLKAPSPTTVIACIGLFLALGGGGYIAFAHGVGATAAKKKRVKVGPTGPQGPPGANGLNGANGLAGANGIARAFGTVTADSIVSCSPQCGLGPSKGVTSVTYQGFGLYCITAPGIDPSQTSIIASVDYNTSIGPATGSVENVKTGGGICPAGQHGVKTERLSVDNTGTPTLTSAITNQIGFDFVIP